MSNEKVPVAAYYAENFSDLSLEPGSLLAIALANCQIDVDGAAPEQFLELVGKSVVQKQKQTRATQELPVSPRLSGSPSSKTDQLN